MEEASLSFCWIETIPEMLLHKLLIAALNIFFAVLALQSSSYGKIYSRHVPLLSSKVVHSILDSESSPRCSLHLIIDSSSHHSGESVHLMRSLVPHGGISLLRMGDEYNRSRTTKDINCIISQTRLVKRKSWCLTVVVVSDDPEFLNTFLQQSRANGLLPLSTKLLAITHCNIQRLRHLHEELSKTNSMLLVIGEDHERCRLFFHMPYSKGEVIHLASCSRDGYMYLIRNLTFFPEKFSPFPHRPNLVVSVVRSLVQKRRMIPDPESPGKEKADYEGPMIQLLKYLSKSLNFSFTYVSPADGTNGRKSKNGTWSGVTGMIARKEAEFSVGASSISASRSEVIDYTVPVHTSVLRMLAFRGFPEVDPWGFLYPLTPIIWASVATSLVIMATTSYISELICKDIILDLRRRAWFTTFLKTLLRQDGPRLVQWLIWERLLLLVWYLTTLVLTVCYAGNLISLLTVRHIGQPFQTLSDVLDHQSLIMAWEKNSVYAKFLESAEHGVFREVANLRKEGRLVYILPAEMMVSPDTLLRGGHYILAAEELVLKMLMHVDASKNGRCDLYLSQESFLYSMVSIMVQKNSPLIQTFNKRITLYLGYGFLNLDIGKLVSNATKCLKAPTKVIIKASLSTSNLWGMFILLLTGELVAMLVFCLEFTVHKTRSSDRAIS